jgi:hypothetical protein
MRLPMDPCFIVFFFACAISAILLARASYLFARDRDFSPARAGAILTPAIVAVWAFAQMLPI